MVHTLFTWLFVHPGVKSIHFVTLKSDRTSGVCPDSRSDHEGVCCPARLYAHFKCVLVCTSE